ncbi:dense granule protein GRA14 [Toxoplasma gondii RUB]|uniref:Dense granule protein GRA14 n=1 Tax=Toxoplasma gondii RUB TaxID=935652 RepID=A0A086LSS5_TOXGO|nr:dense granule protein GRA14 [Toxoplasma gondii RUB]
MQAIARGDRSSGWSSCSWLFYFLFLLLTSEAVAAAASLEQTIPYSVQHQPQQEGILGTQKPQTAPTPQQLIVPVSYLGDGLSYFSGVLRRLPLDVALERLTSAREIPTVAGFVQKYVLAAQLSRSLQSTANGVKKILMRLDAAKNEEGFITDLLKSAPEVQEVLSRFLGSVASALALLDINGLHEAVDASLPVTKAVVMLYLHLVSVVPPKQRDPFSPFLLYLQDAVGEFKIMEDHVASVVAGEAQEENVINSHPQGTETSHRAVVRGGIRMLQSGTSETTKLRRTWWRLFKVAALAVLTMALLKYGTPRVRAFLERRRMRRDGGGDSGDFGEEGRSKGDVSTSDDMPREPPPPYSPPMYPFAEPEHRWAGTYGTSHGGYRVQPTAPPAPASMLYPSLHRLGYQRPSE